MSAEKSCETCGYYKGNAYCGTPENIECLIPLTAWIPKNNTLTPAQQYAEELLEALKNLLNAEQCPNCNNVGSYQISDSDIEQCEWCDYVENSLFNRKNEAMQLIAKAEKR